MINQKMSKMVGNTKMTRTMTGSSYRRHLSWSANRPVPTPILQGDKYGHWLPSRPS